VTLPQWDRVMEALKRWRADLPWEGGAGGGREKAPSVSTVAEAWHGDPWAVLASTIISLRTKDEVTSEAAKRLLEKASSPEALLDMPEEEIAKLIYPAGFYRTKAHNLKEIAAILTQKYGGKVPADMEALLSLPGAGRKTANLVLVEAFDMEGICVDTHVHRICNRAGWVATKTPEETEARLREILPKKYWKSINALLVLYGQRVCQPVSPFCSRCVIPGHCVRAGVTRSR